MPAQIIDVTREVSTRRTSDELQPEYRFHIRSTDGSVGAAVSAELSPPAELKGVELRSDNPDPDVITVVVYDPDAMIESYLENVRQHAGQVDAIVTSVTAHVIGYFIEDVTHGRTTAEVWRGQPVDPSTAAAWAGQLLALATRDPLLPRGPMSELSSYEVAEASWQVIAPGNYAKPTPEGLRDLFGSAWSTARTWEKSDPERAAEVEHRMINLLAKDAADSGLPLHFDPQHGVVNAMLEPPIDEFGGIQTDPIELGSIQTSPPPAMRSEAGVTASPIQAYDLLGIPALVRGAGKLAGKLLLSAGEHVAAKFETEAAGHVADLADGIVTPTASEAQAAVEHGPAALGSVTSRPPSAPPFDEADIDQLVGRLDNPGQLEPPQFAMSGPVGPDVVNPATGRVEPASGLSNMTFPKFPKDEHFDATKIGFHSKAYFQDISDVRPIDAFPTGPHPELPATPGAPVPPTEVKVTGPSPGNSQLRPVISSETGGNVEVRLHDANPKAPEGSFSHDNPTVEVNTPGNKEEAHKFSWPGQPVDAAAGERADIQSTLAADGQPTSSRYRTADDEWLRLATDAEEQAYAEGHPRPPGVATPEQNASAHYPVYGEPVDLGGGPSNPGGTPAPADAPTGPDVPPAASHGAGSGTAGEPTPDSGDVSRPGAGPEQTSQPAMTDPPVPATTQAQPVIDAPDGIPDRSPAPASDQPLAARYGHDPHSGAAAGPDDPGHTAATLGPLAPAGHHADQGAAASMLDPAHHAVTYGPPAPAGHHADQGAAASMLDPAHHDQSQSAAQQLSLQMYQQAQHVDQQTQHVHEPAHQQAYDHGGHGE
jgi:hypothetical protein